LTGGWDALHIEDSRDQWKQEPRKKKKINGTKKLLKNHSRYFNSSKLGHTLVETDFSSFSAALSIIRTLGEAVRKK
jgi:hypothetical protein